MKKHVYAFYHVGAAFYLKPEINEIEKENALISMKRDLLKNSQVYIKNGIQDCDFVYLGTFDDETGSFDGSPSILLSQAEISKILAGTLGEVIKDGKN